MPVKNGGNLTSVHLSRRLDILLVVLGLEVQLASSACVSRQLQSDGAQCSTIDCTTIASLQVLYKMKTYLRNNKNCQPFLEYPFPTPSIRGHICIKLSVLRPFQCNHLIKFTIWPSLENVRPYIARKEGLIHFSPYLQEYLLLVVIGMRSACWKVITQYSDLWLKLFIMLVRNSYLLLLLPLLIPGVPGEAVHQGLECNDRASTLCLSKGYSTFDLPLRTKPNLINIGKMGKICLIFGFTGSQKKLGILCIYQ